MRNLGLLAFAALTGFAGVYGFSQPAVRSASAAVLGPMVNCTIKGNISIDTGERIYHTPGGYYYSGTRISPEYGERWFCSEAEAVAAGWRRSRR